MSIHTTNICDVKDCGKTSNQHLELPEMTIKAFSTDGLGTMLIHSGERRMDLCSTHFTEFMESDFAYHSHIEREAKVLS